METFISTSRREKSYAYRHWNVNKQNNNHYNNSSVR